MANLIDLEEVQHAVAPALARYKADSQKPGGEGALARLGIDVDLAMTLWRCKETNRETAADDIIDAMLTAFAAHIIGEIVQHIPGQDQRLIAAITMGRSFIQKIICGLGGVHDGDCPATFVASREVGTA